MLACPARYCRLAALATALVLLFLTLHFWEPGFRQSTVLVHDSHLQSDTTLEDTAAGPRNETHDETHDEAPPSPQAQPPCQPLPGIEDVLVVLKTGITESQSKLPVHLRTTLRCIPHRLIVSDYAEKISGEHTVDVLRHVDETVKQSNDDFRLYNRVRKGGRGGLLASDLARQANSPTGMPMNPGWKLDKWKFLPMVAEAWRARPEASWFVFLEADTYPIWRNLLSWLEPLDPSRPLYMGNPVQIADLIFAHGGSGFVLSQSAVLSLVTFHSKRVAEWNILTANHWAGDGVLGKALAADGVPLTWSTPLFSTRSVWEMDVFHGPFEQSPWCARAGTFHHMTPADVERMYAFDQEWFADASHSSLLHRDIFHHLIRTNLVETRDDWDNFAGNRKNKVNDNDTGDILAPPAPASLKDCAAFCARQADCMQYRLDDEGHCSTSSSPMRGVPRPGFSSGWNLERIDRAVEEMRGCGEA